MIAVLVMEQTELSQKSIKVNHTIGSGPATMIGNHKDRCIARQFLMYLADRVVEPLVNTEHSVAEALHGRWIVQMMRRIHVVPEIVLHRVDRHEGEHHHVSAMLLHQVEARLQPLSIDSLHLGQDQIGRASCRERVESSVVSGGLNEK